MSASAQIVRLNIHLEPSGLTRVLDRLAVLGIVPRTMSFHRGQANGNMLFLELDGLSDTTRQNLVLRLEQIPAVQKVRIGD